MNGVNEANVGHIKAGLMMMLSSLFFIINDTGVKVLTETMPTGSK